VLLTHIFVASGSCASSSVGGDFVVSVAFMGAPSRSFLPPLPSLPSSMRTHVSSTFLVVFPPHDMVLLRTVGAFGGVMCWFD
jgi:hypothetical protein